MPDDGPHGAIAIIASLDTKGAEAAYKLVRDELRRRGVVICLHASIETILDRTSRQGNRPLLDVPDPEARLRSG